jgi:hypothetical protein
MQKMRAIGGEPFRVLRIVCMPDQKLPAELLFLLKGAHGKLILWDFSAFYKFNTCFEQKQLRKITFETSFHEYSA